jgi:hypothetical protein
MLRAHPGGVVQRRTARAARLGASPKLRRRPSGRSCSASSASRNMPGAGDGRLGLITRRLSDNGSVLLSAYRELAVRSGRKLCSRRRPSGWWTTSIWSSDSCARSARASHPPTTGQLPKLEGRPPRRLSAGVRNRLGVRRPSRQSIRPRCPPSVHRCVSGGPAAHHRRALGPPSHPPTGPGREPAENGRDIVRARRLRRRADEVADGLLGVGGGSVEAAGTLERTAVGGLPQPFTVQLIQRLGTTTRRPPPASPGCSLVSLPTAPPRRHRRRDPASAGGNQRDRAQHHHQSPHDQLVRMGAVRRGTQPRRSRSGRSGSYREMSFGHPRPVPPRHRRPLEGPEPPNSRSPKRRFAWPVPSSRIAESTIRASSCSARGRRRLEERSGTAQVSDSMLARFGRRHPRSSTSARSRW